MSSRRDADPQVREGRRGCFALLVAGGMLIGCSIFSTDPYGWWAVLLMFTTLR